MRTLWRSHSYEPELKMAVIPAFSDNVIESLAHLLDGPTGSEIGALLVQVGIDDPGASMTKWRRLREAFAARQAKDRCANTVCAFIQASMDPVRFVGRAETFESLREQLNVTLAFVGLAVGPDGKLRSAEAAKTLGEAEGRAQRLRQELTRRSVHPDVLRFCRAELLQENYFHAVFEATKSVADKIRHLTGLDLDGAELVDRALAFDQIRPPTLAFNTRRSEAERSEHRGMMNLLKGMFGTFRNVTAHVPKIHWNITEHDALDLLTLCSLLHRRLDSAVRTGAGPASSPTAGSGTGR